MPRVGRPHGQHRATADHVSLAQVVGDRKSTEIAAIPEPLKLLEVSGCLVAVDATGCRAEFAGKIVEGKVNHVLAVNANQPTLHENSLRWQLDMSFGEGRSRIRDGHAGADFAIAGRMALSLLKNEESPKVGVKTIRLTARQE